MKHGSYCIDPTYGRPACGQPDGHDAPRDEWLVGGNGSETPFLRNGRTYLYVWNPARNVHGFLDIGTDIVIEDHEFYINA